MEVDLRNDSPLVQQTLPEHNFSTYVETMLSSLSWATLEWNPSTSYQLFAWANVRTFRVVSMTKGRTAGDV